MVAQHIFVNVVYLAITLEHDETGKMQANSFLAQLLWDEATILYLASKNLGWVAYGKREMAQKTVEEKNDLEKRKQQKQTEMKSLLEACTKFAESYSMSRSSITIFNMYLMDITLYKLFAHKNLNCCCGCWSNKVEICKSHLIPKSVLGLILKMYPNSKMLELTGADEPRILQSPGSHKWKMLCVDCEQLLSKSEETFAGKLVEKVLQNIENSTVASIDYESWLKFTLVSIVWRLIICRMIREHVGFPCASFPHHNLLHACRYFWGKDRDVPKIEDACSRPPNVALIISPPLRSRIRGFDNFTHFSHGSGFFGPNANIFYVHFSVFNILVMENGQEWNELPKRVKILDRGQFQIPPKKERFDGLPDWFMNDFREACAECQIMFDGLKKDEKMERHFSTKKPEQPINEKGMKLPKTLVDSIIQQATDRVALNDKYRSDTRKPFQYLPAWFLSEEKHFDLYRGTQQTAKNDQRDDMTVFGAGIYLCRNRAEINNNNRFALIIIDQNSFLYMCCCLEWNPADETNDETIFRENIRYASCEDEALNSEMQEFWHDKTAVLDFQNTLDEAASHVWKLMDFANEKKQEWFTNLTYKDLIQHKVNIGIDLT